MNVSANLSNIESINAPLLDEISLALADSPSTPSIIDESWISIALGQGIHLFY